MCDFNTMERVNLAELVKSLRICGDWKQQVRLAGSDRCEGCKFCVDGDCLSFKGDKELLLNEAADAIEELQKALESVNDAHNEGYDVGYWAGRRDYEPKWIPVNERLPEAYKEVYVTDGEYIARANLLDEVFPGDQPCWSYTGIGKITHWCERIPLPKPLKEETE